MGDAEVDRLSKELANVKGRAVSKIRQLTLQVQQLESRLSASTGEKEETSTSGASSEGDKEERERFVKIDSPRKILSREAELRAREEAVNAREEQLRKWEHALHLQEQALDSRGSHPSVSVPPSESTHLTADGLIWSLNDIHDTLRDACARSQLVDTAAALA